MTQAETVVAPLHSRLAQTHSGVHTSSMAISEEPVDAQRTLQSSGNSGLPTITIVVSSSLVEQRDHLSGIYL